MFPIYDNDGDPGSAPCYSCGNPASLLCSTTRPDLFPDDAMCSRCAPSYIRDYYHYRKESGARLSVRPIRCSRLGRVVARGIKDTGALASLFFSPTLNEVLCLSLLGGPVTHASRKSYTYRLSGLCIGGEYVTEDGPLSGLSDRPPSASDQLDLLNGVKDCVCASTALGARARELASARRYSVFLRDSVTKRAEHLYAWSRVAYRLAAM